MLQRALLYTGMTRPRKQMIFLATEAALKMAAENAETVRRNTLLAQRIRMLAARKAA
jgi:ATP-dependent exoDNAse (exonuclease V) alpha subunit